MPEINQITIAVIRNKLLSIAKEMKETIMRTSFHPIIYEDVDFACGILDANAGVLAEAPTIHVFMGSLGPAVRKSVEAMGNEGVEPGDIIGVAAVPEFTGSHPPDAMVFAPLFHEDRFFGYAASKGHLIDLGAKDPYPVDSTDAFQEGLRLPPVKLYKKGELQREIQEVLKWNSRAPEVIWGDLQAQIAALRLAKARLETLLGKYDVDFVTACISQANQLAESAVKDVLARIPHGSWVGEDYMDSNGIELDKPVKLRIKFTITESAFVIDYSESDRQQKGPTNCPLLTTVSVSRLMAKTILWPRGPAIEGHFRPLEVKVPKGTLFNPDSSAPTMLYGWPATVALEVMFKTLAPVFPDRVPACSAGDVAGNTYYGWSSRNGKYWWTSAIQGVGHGAKSFEDGADALTHFVVACSKNCPVEVEETQVPMFVERYELLHDSGGPGKYRGGLGYRKDYRFLEPGFIICTVEKGKYPHSGVNGGKPGRGNVVVVRTDNKSVEKYAIAKSSEGYEVLKFPSLALDRGDIVSERWGGGGGWGDPFEREIEAVRADVVNQYVSIESASHDYGVIIDPNNYQVDVEATKRIRQGPHRT